MLIACYSAHPLVPRLAARHPDLCVTGILEASITATLPLLSPSEDRGGGGGVGGGGGGGGWAIVTTGQFWEAHLGDAARAYLGQSSDAPNARFRGVFTTGLTAGDFHGGGVSPETIRARLAEATRRLLRAAPPVDCVVMGCAGMAGLEDIIRAAAVDEYGPERARGVYVVDGVQAGIGVLEQMVNNRSRFLPI